MNSLPGFRDFYPETLAVRRYIFGQWRDVARRYGFREYDGPPLEPLELYTLKSGDEIVAQLYHFVDKGQRAVALRPEMTPTLARMVAARQRHYKKPIKWFAIPQLFRYERQQRGRLREHFQFNADIIGEPGVGADAELIALAIDSLRVFGLTQKDFVVRVSDRRVWREYLLGLGIPEAQHHSVFQAVDKLEREPIEKTRQRLAAVTSKIDEVLALPKDDMRELLDPLGELAGYCEVDFKIVRGLAYYTGIVWEIHDRKGQLRAVAGGGRYDNLLKLVGAVDLPALGFGMGDVVLTELLKQRGLLPETGWQLDCFVVIAEETLRAGALRLIHELREAGIAVDYALAPARVAKQFEMASALGARFALTIGPEEWKDGEVRLKTLASGVEERVRAADLTTKLTKDTKTS